MGAHFSYQAGPESMNEAERLQSLWGAHLPGTDGSGLG